MIKTQKDVQLLVITIVLTFRMAHGGCSKEYAERMAGWMNKK